MYVIYVYMQGRFIFNHVLTILFQLQLESRSIFVHMSIYNNNRTIRVYFFLYVKFKTGFTRMILHDPRLSV